MRKLLMAALVVSMLTAVLHPQDVPKGEIFGGYSLLHSSQFDVSGWDVAVTGNLNRWLGITSDVSGHYSRQDAGGTKLKSNIHSFMFGPQVSYPTSRFMPFTHALFGVSRQTDQVSINGTLAPSTGETYFRMALGGGLDVQLTRIFALRPVQADLVLFRLTNHNFKEFRYSGGVVLRLRGKR